MAGSVSLEPLPSGAIAVGEKDGEVGVTLVRTGDLSGDVTVRISIGGGDATPGQDYVQGQQFRDVVIPDGVERLTVDIPILDDDLSESTESFSVQTVSAQGATWAFPRTVRIDILDDENPVEPPTNPPLVSPYEVSLVTVAQHQNGPISLEFSPIDPDLYYAATKQGKVEVYDIKTGDKEGTVLDITDIVNSRGDRGLLDITLHPDFENTPYLYAFFVVDPPETAGKTGNAGRDGDGNRYQQLVRYTLDENDDYMSVVPGSAETILGAAGQSLDDISGGGALDFTFPEFGDNPASDWAPGSTFPDITYIEDYVKVDARSHAGGAIAFSPIDGMLYVSVGDGVSPNLPDRRNISIQDPDSLSGKILRIDPITGEGLADNPFYEGGSLTANSAKVWQMGLRNPFSMGFDQDGELFIADTGWGDWEEINNGPAGANFGWPYYEGGDNGELLRTRSYKDREEAAAYYASVASGEIVITPAYRGFSHDEGDPGVQVQGIVGGDVIYDGTRYPLAVQNDYAFVDISQGEYFLIDTNDRREVTFLTSTPGAAAAVHQTQAPDGFIYYADLKPGQAGGFVGRLRIVEPLAPGEVRTITDEDFEDGVVEGWGAVPLATDETQYLGRLGKGDGVVSKVFDLPSAATTLTIAFDFIELDDWDGDAFNVFYDGAQVFSLGFSNGNDAARSGTGAGIAWTVTPLDAGGANFAGGAPTDQAHRVTLTVTDPGETFTLGVSGALSEGKANEAFGIDNVLITATDGDTPPPPPPPPPPTGGLVVEAEDMAASGYRVKNRDIASNGQILSLVGAPAGETGTATFAFGGDAGTYDIVFAGFDENDGASTFTLAQDGAAIANWTLDEDPAGGGIAFTTLVTRTVAQNVSVAPGDVFLVTATENAGEHARFDYLEFVPTDGGGGPSPAALSLSIDPTSITENGGSATGTVTRSGETGAALTVALSTDDETEATTPATVTIAAGQSAATFAITAVDDAAVDGAQTVTIAASAAGLTGATDTLSVTDDDAPPPSGRTVIPADPSLDGEGGVEQLAPGVTVKASNFVTGKDVLTVGAAGFGVDSTDNPTEDAALIDAAGGALEGVLFRFDDAQDGMTVTLASFEAGDVARFVYDTASGRVVENVTVADGVAAAGGVAFDLGDGVDRVLVRAQAGEFGVAEIAYGAGAPALALSIDPASISENGGAATGTVTRPGDVGAPLTVSLSSDDTSEATTPASVTIPAGQSSASFAITAVDDALVDGTQTPTVTASAPGFAAAAVALPVIDDDAAPPSGRTVIAADPSLNGEGGKETLAPGLEVKASNFATGQDVLTVGPAGFGVDSTDNAVEDAALIDAAGGALEGVLFDFAAAQDGVTVTLANFDAGDVARFVYDTASGRVAANLTIADGMATAGGVAFDLGDAVDRVVVRAQEGAFGVAEIAYDTPL